MLHSESQLHLCHLTDRPDPVSALRGSWIITDFCCTNHAAQYPNQRLCQVSYRSDGEALSPDFSCESRATADLCKWRSQDQRKWQAAAEWLMTMVIVLPELLNFLF